jgi:hypothetical protein
LAISFDTDVFSGRLVVDELGSSSQKWERFAAALLKEDVPGLFGFPSWARAEASTCTYSR